MSNVANECENELQQGIHPWMANLIALGGIIGSCYFIGSGYLIKALGPSAAIAFVIGGAIVYVIMQSFAELLVNVPRRGSFVSYAAEFIHPLWAVANGWSYWLNWVAYVPSEAVAGGIIMIQIFGKIPFLTFAGRDFTGFFWAILFLILVTFVNLGHVKNFGMIESVLAILKIGAVFIFSLVALLLVFGAIGNGVGTSVVFPSGHANFKDIFPSGVFPLISFLAIILVNFQGSEIIGLAAAETCDPETTVPRACRQVAWRILCVYVIPITCLVLILSYTDSGLDGSMFAAALSKYAAADNLVWLSWIAQAFAVVVLTAAFSCANSGMFGTVRALYALAIEGLAPKAFMKLNKNGVPQNATIFTLCACWIVLGINAFFGASDFYATLISVSGFTGAICWITICLSQVSFRRRVMKRGYTEKDLKAPAKWSPYSPIIIGVLLEAIGLSMMLFSGNSILIHAFYASIICLLIPVSIFVIAEKMGKVTYATKLHSSEKTFDELFPMKATGKKKVA